MPLPRATARPVSSGRYSITVPSKRRISRGLRCKRPDQRAALVAAREARIAGGWRADEIGQRSQCRRSMLLTSRPCDSYSVVDNSRYRQNAFAICICSGVRHSGSNRAGEHTRMLKHFARDVATFRRFKL